MKRALTPALKQGVSRGEIASALALGIFIAFLPMVGVHTIMAFGLAFFLRLNPLVVFLGTQISNPLTFPFQLFISAQAGNLVLHGSFLRIRFSGDVDWVKTYLIPLIAGSLMLGALCSVLSYVWSYRLLKKRIK
ncbi:MAG: DUF2062 domain-containing protein [bacterium]